MRQYKLDKKVKFREIKSNNPRLKQSEIAKDLAISTATSQRYGREIIMHSPWRIIQSSNTNTRKQKTSNHTEHDLKMTTNDLKMTLNDLKMTWNDLKETSKETVNSSRKSKLKDGDPIDDNSSQGRDRIEQPFSPINDWLYRKYYKKILRFKTKKYKPLRNLTKNLFRHNQKQDRML